MQARLDEHLESNARSVAFTDQYTLQPLYDIHLYSNLEHEMESNGDISFIWMLISIAIFILLIACMNFMNLAIVRSITRASEIGMRKVVGATKKEIILQCLGEVLIFSGIAFVVALGLLSMILPTFRSMTGYLLSIPALEPWSLLGGMSLVLMVTILAGGYPALLLSKIDPAAIFRGSTSKSSAVMLRKTLVIIQFSMASVLLIGTGIVYQQLGFIKNKHLGFIKDHVMVVPEIQGMDFRMIVDRFPHHAGVVSATGANYIPGRAAGRGTLPITPVRRSDNPAVQPTEMQIVYTTGGYVRTLGLGLLNGRDVSFERDFRQVSQLDGSTSFVVDGCLLNEEAINRLGWPSPDVAINQFVRVGDQQIRVVGIVENFHLKTLHERIEPLIITIGGGGIFAIRFVPGNTTETLLNLEAQWKESTPHIPIIYTFLDDDVERLYSADQLLGRLVTLFTTLAVFTACLGLFGLAVFSTQQRTREIGVRKVLGASVGQLVMLLSRNSLFSSQSPTSLPGQWPISSCANGCRNSRITLRFPCCCSL